MVIANPEQPSRRLADERAQSRRRAAIATGVTLFMIVALAVGYLIGAGGDWRGAMHLATSAAKEAAITARIETAFAWSDQIPADTIDVETQGAVVRLRGSVPSDDVRRLALDIAESTEGVERVEDQLLIAELEQPDGTDKGKES